MDPGDPPERALDKAASSDDGVAGGGGGDAGVPAGRRMWRRRKRKNADRAKHAALDALHTISSHSALWFIYIYIYIYIYTHRLQISAFNLARGDGTFVFCRKEYG